MLAINPQRLPAGRQDGQDRKTPEQSFGEVGHRIDKMLAAIEDQQHPATMKNRNQALIGLLRRQQPASGCSHGIRDHARHADRGEIDEGHAVGKHVAELVPELEGKRRLADPGRPDKREKAAFEERGSSLGKCFLVSDRVTERVGQLWALDHPPAPGGAGRIRPGHLPGKAIATPGDRRDVPDLLCALTQRLAERGDMEAKAAFLDDHAGPGGLSELPLGDDLAGTGNQGAQYVHRTPAERHQDPVPLQPPLPENQPVRAET